MDNVRPHKTHITKATSYKPLFVILGIIIFIVALIQLFQGSFDLMDSMRYFMGLFFLAFGSFKLMDLKGFVDMFAEYDVVTKHVRAWGFLYPFFELALGFAYLVNADPISTNLVTIALMTVSSIGVAKALSSKQKIRCACLGSVVKLPMTTVTLIEDLGMGLMAVVMLLMLL
jgi:hypothetical protein